MGVSVAIGVAGFLTARFIYKRHARDLPSLPTGA
jgi:hypothetical protein